MQINFFKSWKQICTFSSTCHRHDNFPGSITKREQW